MALYDFKKKPALTTKEGEKEVLYPSIVYTGKIGTRELLNELAGRSTFQAGEIE
ncbi:MAG: DNA-binding protein, partial [Bacteroides sp.]